MLWLTSTKWFCFNSKQLSLVFLKTGKLGHLICHYCHWPTMMIKQYPKFGKVKNVKKKTCDLELMNYESSLPKQPRGEKTISYGNFSSIDKKELKQWAGKQEDLTIPLSLIKLYIYFFMTLGPDFLFLSAYTIENCNYKFFLWSFEMQIFYNSSTSS